jgi:hypothetical protein
MTKWAGSCTGLARVYCAFKPQRFANDKKSSAPGLIASGLIAKAGSRCSMLIGPLDHE